MADKWLTTQEAAELANYHRDHILRLIADGRIKARKFATVWQVDRDSLLTYVRKAEKLGRRRGRRPRT